MLFSTSIFLFIFLPIVLFFYYISKNSFKNYILLISSLLFYAYGEPKFVFVMMISMVVNYLLGLLISFFNNRNLLIKRLIFIVAILSNLSLIFYYKYFDFFITNINGLFSTNFTLQNILLPIGISFFTFQGMSYIIDLYNNKYFVQKNPLKLALYIALFPQLIAGPIVRYIDVNNQIDKRKHTIEKFSDGINRFVMGLAKKVIIANSFALIADSVFNNPINEFTLAWIGILAYAIQIYFDFSGYSDMAIGLGKMFGFDFLENFNYPYISKSITEFWRRWHISLSSWFRDYVYIPLGGNRRGNVYFNLFVVFLLTGLWHGASWSFLIWGLWHGLFIIIERIGKKFSLKYLKLLSRPYTILIVLIGWVLFRSVDISYAIDYILLLFSVNKFSPDLNTLIIIKENVILFIIAIICATPIYKLLFDKFSKRAIFNYIHIVYIILLFIIVISYIVTSQYNPFIYFNF